jgi:hypothetical protein
MFIAKDKIHSIKRCELSTVIITVRGSCLLVGCIYNLDCYRCNHAINSYKMCNVNKLWSGRLNCTVCDALILCWCSLFAGMMRTELEVDSELHFVIPLMFHRATWLKRLPFSRVFKRYIVRISAAITAVFFTCVVAVSLRRNLGIVSLIVQDDFLPHHLSVIT